MNKKTIWILEENVSTQMVLAEILELKYDLYFFDGLESLRAFQKNGAKPPQLILSNLLACRGRLEGVIEDRPKNTERPLTLALGPLGISLALCEDAALSFDKTLFYPFSKSELQTAVESLLEDANLPSMPLRLLKADSSTDQRQTN